MDFLKLAQTRYTTKHYNPNLPVGDAEFATLGEILRLCPASVNSQPWHFVMVGTAEGKERILPAIMDFNQPRTRDSSRVVVMCARDNMGSAYQNHFVEQEIKDGRLPTPELQAQHRKAVAYFAGLHTQDERSVLEWTGKQTYLALGVLLFAAASMGIDATPVEGFEAGKMDAILGLREKNLRSQVVVLLGHRSEDDANATRAKSRLPGEEILTWL